MENKFSPLAEKQGSSEKDVFGHWVRRNRNHWQGWRSVVYSFFFPDFPGFFFPFIGFFFFSLWRYVWYNEFQDCQKKKKEFYLTKLSNIEYLVNYLLRLGEVGLSLSLIFSFSFYFLVTDILVAQLPLNFGSLEIPFYFMNVHWRKVIYMPPPSKPSTFVFCIIWFSAWL